MLVYEYDIHGTTALLRNAGLNFFKMLAHLGHNDLFTAGTDFKLIPFLSEEAPTVTKTHHATYKDLVLIDDCNYVQWSGGFGEERVNTAKLLADDIREKIKHRGNQKVVIFIDGHSHGGTIGLDLVEQFAKDENVYFVLNSVATPLNTDRIVNHFDLYRQKILVWKHSFYPDDWIARAGTLFGQDFNLFQRIEDVLSHLPPDLTTGKRPGIPLGWKSIQQEFDFPANFDAHNSSVLGKAAEETSEIMRPRVEAVLDIMARAEKLDLNGDDFSRFFEKEWAKKPFPKDPPPTKEDEPIIFSM